AASGVCVIPRISRIPHIPRIPRIPRIPHIPGGKTEPAMRQLFYQQGRKQVAQQICPAQVRIPRAQVAQTDEPFEPLEAQLYLPPQAVEPEHLPCVIDFARKSREDED